LRIAYASNEGIADDGVVFTENATGALNRYLSAFSFTYLGVRAQAAVNFSGTYSFKQVTDPPSTGAKIVTTKGGSTRGWYHADTGFDPNVGGTYKVYYVGDG
jgi:hypothetical protein